MQTEIRPSLPLHVHIPVYVSCAWTSIYLHVLGGNIGGRKTDDIVNWLEKRAGPPALELATQEDVMKLIEDKPVVVIGYFENAESAEAKAFIAAAETEDSITFAYSTCADVAKAMDSGVPAIWLYKNVS